MASSWCSFSSCSTKWSSDGNGQSGLMGLQSTFRAGVPMIHADVDRVKAKSLGVPLDTIFGTLQTALGSAYVNDFNKFGRTWQVRVQADQRFRLEPEDIKKLEVRDRQGSMVPLGHARRSRRGWARRSFRGTTSIRRRR